jgi:murein tripeptide amidase MpaA
MINIDGVSRGNYRFSAAGVDLNRKWKQPSEQYQP